MTQVAKTKTKKVSIAKSKNGKNKVKAIKKYRYEAVYAHHSTDLAFLFDRMTNDTTLGDLVWTLSEMSAALDSLLNHLGENATLDDVDALPEDWYPED